MEINSIWGFIIAFFGFIGGAGVISGLLLRRFDKMEKKLDSQEQSRIEESYVIITGIKAIGHLAEATAIAQRDGKTNGEMKTAIEYYHESRNSLNAYLVKKAAIYTHSRG